MRVRDRYQNFTKEDDVADYVSGIDSAAVPREPDGTAANLGRRATLRAVCAAVAFGSSLYAVTRSVRACGARKRTAWMALAVITAGEGMAILSTLPPMEPVRLTEAGIAA
jgi:hypothetical protein